MANLCQKLLIFGIFRTKKEHLTFHTPSVAREADMLTATADKSPPEEFSKKASSSASHIHLSNLTAEGSAEFAPVISLPPDGPARAGYLKVNHITP